MNIYVVFDEESDLFGPRTYFLHPDLVFVYGQYTLYCFVNFICIFIGSLLKGAYWEGVVCSAYGFSGGRILKTHRFKGLARAALRRVSEFKAQDRSDALAVRWSGGRGRWSILRYAKRTIVVNIYFFSKTFGLNNQGLLLELRAPTGTGR